MEKTRQNLIGLLRRPAIRLFLVQRIAEIDVARGFTDGRFFRCDLLIAGAVAFLGGLVAQDLVGQFVLRGNRTRCDQRVIPPMIRVVLGGLRIAVGLHFFGFDSIFVALDNFRRNSLDILIRDAGLVVADNCQVVFGFCSVMMCPFDVAPRHSACIAKYTDYCRQGVGRPVWFVVTNAVQRGYR